MKSIEEIMAQGATQKTSTLSTVLDSIRLLTCEGRFAEVAELLAIWGKHEPASKPFIQGRLAPIVLNNYLFKLDILDLTQFISWAESHESWAQSVANQAFSPRQLPKAVGLVVESMERYRDDFVINNIQ